jgi:hypothetical protein
MACAPSRVKAFARSSLRDVDQYAAGGAAAHQIDRRIDLIERELVGDEPLEGQAAGPVEPDQSGKGDVRDGVAAM